MPRIYKWDKAALEQKARERAYAEFQKIAGKDGQISKTEYENSVFKNLQKDKNGNYKVPNGFDSVTSYLESQMNKFNSADTYDAKTGKQGKDKQLSFEEYYKMVESRYKCEIEQTAPSPNAKYIDL